MRSNSRRVNPFDLIARVLAERLHRSEASDGLRALVIGATRWDDVAARARGELVLPAFGAAARDLGVLGLLEPGMRASLVIAHAANLERNRRIRAQLPAFVSVLNQAGIEPVLLKGAIRLVDGLYPDSGWRTMRDLDVLVPEAAFGDALEALGDVGYRLVRPLEPKHKEALVRRDGDAVPFEIHRELFATGRRQRLLRGSDVLSGSRPAMIDGTRIRLPSAVDQLVHLIGHSQIGHSGHAYGRIMLRDRLEAAALLQRQAERIDWQAVCQRFDAAGYGRPLLVFALALRDGGFHSPAVPGRIDALTAVQQRRIALQARSAALTRVSLYAGWCAVVLKLQVTEREVGRPKIVQTVRKLLLDRTERQRITAIWLRGGPRQW